MIAINEKLANELYTDYYNLCESILSSGNDLPDSLLVFWEFVMSKGFEFDEAQAINNLVTVEY